MLKTLADNVSKYSASLTPGKGDSIDSDNWNIIMLHWTGGRSFCFTNFNAPDETDDMASIWADRDYGCREWRAEVIGVDISPLMAQWVREALTDGD